MNLDKTGGISPDELKFYIQHWGLEVSDTKFTELFNYIDADADGKISYKDFTVRVGSEIHPGETLYFR